MLLEGSCHCGTVRFSVHSSHPYPFNLCYCSICRKTAGGGGYAINLGGDYETLKIRGKEYIRVYQARIKDPATGKIKESPGQRSFCKKCGSALWVWDPRWPDLVHPFASAIDTDLPVPPEHTHMMLNSKARWVELHIGPKDQKFDEYPQESLADWHRRLGLVSDSAPR
ncbi:GFA family protein [Marinobacterium aestuariivivens]|uniref:GFA family protein n=1 Tax=Marinobacterium aestuariivivens TaxID=1698799 RepID=A0ABW2A6Z5_9GAMM